MARSKDRARNSAKARGSKNDTPVEAVDVASTEATSPVQETVVETTVAPTSVVAPATSIRKTINTLLAEGKSTKEITVVIQAAFPGTQAAAKPTKHIAHYRCLRKKELAKSA